MVSLAVFVVLVPPPQLANKPSANLTFTHNHWVPSNKGGVSGWSGHDRTKPTTGCEKGLNKRTQAAMIETEHAAPRQPLNVAHVHVANERPHFLFQTRPAHMWLRNSRGGVRTAQRVGGRREARRTPLEVLSGPENHATPGSGVGREKECVCATWLGLRRTS